MFPEWTWIVGLMLGATIGSFLNVVIYRVPRDLSLSKPAHSYCPSCEHPLSFFPDMVPLLSWIFMRGKCRYCQAKIPPRYFFVELVNGILWAGIWYQFMCVGQDWVKAIAYMLAAGTLVAVAWIDWESYTIPDALNVALLVIGLGFHAINGTIMTAIWGALLGWGLIFGIGLLGRLLFGKDAMGEGDVLLMRGVGALVGIWPLVVAIMIAVFAGAVHGITMILLDKMGKLGAPKVEEGGEETMIPAQPIGEMLFVGILMLLCVDVFALFFPPVARWLQKAMPEAASLSDEEWTPPSIRYIPFGPFLALGTVVVLVFEPWVLGQIDAYLSQFSVKP
jgi:leader peptidase (prepilin peptidase)/N-methyltransferase